MMKRKKLTDAELEIMQVIWELNEATVRQVYEVLLQRKQTAYTTVMTMMNILEDKGHLERRKCGRAYLYRPVESKHQVVSSLLNDFLSRVFDGSAKPLLLSMIQDKRISREDLAEISKLIEEQES